jgi:hypothetical protein
MKFCVLTRKGGSRFGSDGLKSFLLSKFIVTAYWGKDEVSKEIRQSQSGLEGDSLAVFPDEVTSAHCNWVSSLEQHWTNMGRTLDEDWTRMNDLYRKVRAVRKGSGGENND